MSNEVVEYLTENDVVVVLNCDLAKFGKRVIAAREKRDKKLQEEAMKAGFELVEDSSRKGADAMISRKEMVEQKMSNNVLEYLTEDDVVVVLNTGDPAYFEKRVYVAREQRRMKLQAEAMKAGFEFVEDSSRKGADVMITRKELKEQFNAYLFEIFMIFAFVLLLIIVSVCSSVFLST